MEGREIASERINIIVSERGSRVVKRRLRGIGTTATASSQGVNLLKTALGAIGGALVLRKLVQTADAFTLIQNRLKLVTTGTENLADVTQQLLDISNRTRTAFQENADLYNRVAIATKELGVEQKQLLQFTESLNQAVILSGASATEAAAGLIQLGQGLGSGALRGDELRSVLEQLPVVADVIAKELGVTRGELRKMGQDGAITADIILRAFKNAREELGERFGLTVSTTGQALVVLSNHVTAAVGRWNELVGATKRLIGWIGITSENIGLLAKLFGAAGLTAGILLATHAMNTFTAAIATNPLGALTIALLYTIGLLAVFRNEITVSEDSIITLGDVATATWERIREGAATLLDLLKSALPNISAAWTAMFGDLDISFEGFIKGSARILDTYIGLWVGVVNVIKAIWTGLGPALKDITITLLNGMIGVFETGLKKILGTIDAIVDKIPGMGKLFGDVAALTIIPRIENAAEGALIGMDQAIAKGFAEGTKTSIFEDSVNGIFDRAEQIAQKRIRDMAALDAGGPSTAPTGDGAPTSQGQSRALQLMNKDINEQIELLRMSASAREIETLVRKKGIALIPAEQEQYRNELQRLQLIKQVSGILDSVRGAEINLAAAQEELSRQVEAGNISLKQSVEAYRLLQNQALETQTTIAAGWQRGLNSIGDTVTDLATATENTLVNAFNSAEDALVSFVTTGKLDFKSMVDSILGDLTRLIFKMMIVKALESSAGGGGIMGSLAGAFGAGKAGGGHVTAGTIYPVNENGPGELFKPDVPGQIVPTDKVAKAVGEAAAGGGANVTVIVVDSIEKGLAAMRSTEGKRIMVNTTGEITREAI